jgi:prepilin-type N-terminal cleavage/methylation domain-containing protein/prepilin-type processing-associated H-X9-DG protein
MSRTWFAIRRRPGMTLVELLVVIAMIGVLVAIALPALARAMARSQLTRCTNNQYQIAFALLRYDEQRGSIPGWLNDSPNGSPLACAWPVPLLPFMGRTDIHDMWPGLPNNPAVETFVCPANRPSRKLDYPVIHYAGNAGAGGADADDGVFLNLFQSPGTIVSLDAIAEADGTSTTLAFAEKAAVGFQPHTWIYAPPNAPQGGPFGSGPQVPPVFGAATPPGPRFPVINDAASRPFAPSGPHDGGVVVAFCDGHTAFLRNELKPYEYGQLLTRKSRWQAGVNKTNSAAMQPWLLRDGQPYLLDETILRQ